MFVVTKYLLEDHNLDQERIESLMDQLMKMEQEHPEDAISRFLGIEDYQGKEEDGETDPEYPEGAVFFGG